MNRTTAIEWAQHVLNPFVGCSQVSPGCTHCYATPVAARNERMGMAHYAGIAEKTSSGQVVWTGKIASAPNWKARLRSFGAAPALIFVNSMSDFWHEGATTQMRREVLDEMRLYPQHGFQVLTKRPERITEELRALGPLPENFWLGCTVEDQPRVHERLPTLTFIQARLRFLSVEPLLGPVDLSPYLRDRRSGAQLIHWVIVGGESGPGARPMKADWVRAVREQCRSAGVPMFFKQYGTPENNPLAESAPRGTSVKAWVELQDVEGKGGSLLDGVHLKQLPKSWAGSLSPVGGSLGRTTAKGAT